MKRLSSFLWLFCLLTIPALSQTLKSDFSESFSEPDALNSKVFQARNGNTLLINFTAAEGIDITVFDRSHKDVAHSKIVSEQWSPENMKKSSIDGIYNIGENVVLFLEQVDGRKPFLFRLIISPETGKLIKEDKLLEMSKTAMGSGYAQSAGIELPKGFYVEKDAISDAYAVLAFDGRSSDKDQRIELVHFDSNHKEISRGFCNGPQTDSRFVNFLGIVVRGTEKVYLCTYVYDKEPKGGESTPIILSTLKGNSFEHKELGKTNDLKEMKSSFAYNSKANTLELLTLSIYMIKSSSYAVTNYFRTQLFGISSKDNSLLYHKVLDTKFGTAYRTANYKVSREYKGLPMGMVVNDDGTTTIVYQEGISQLMYRTTALDDIGIANYDAQGVDLGGGYVFRSSQSNGTGVRALSIGNYRKGIVKFEHTLSMAKFANPGFFSFDYLSVPKGRYVVFNDLVENEGYEKEDRLKPLLTASTGNTICYQLKGKEVERSYLFGKPDATFSNRFALLSSGNYSEVSGDYAVMLIERKSDDSKQAKIAWVHLN